MVKRYLGRDANLLFGSITGCLFSVKQAFQKGMPCINPNSLYTIPFLGISRGALPFSLSKSSTIGIPCGPGMCLSHYIPSGDT